MKTNFSLLFYLKKSKNYIKGAASIYLRITVEGKRAELATRRECEPEQWNAKAGHTKIFNAFLDKMKRKFVIS
ncbi:hypothetical protein FBD94_22880 [Pedobacter hiemivivus]|uniref:Arm DNA-binding domain-containing protein n=1 Tax=Pedobacter hiemivivus TaxID=2530454 RepID=A0A4U1G6U0_9SPHI|nr:Arm DNA-binding domain-containing protein [Pedobacter hiemivivus]TKC56562.1 hypothetical protein FBD94_22880 [Pedobacter hiemivivus]